MQWTLTIFCFIPFLLFRDNKEIREKYGQQFEYILVDEYQDTNYAQVSIIASWLRHIVVSVLWVMTIRVSTLSVVQILTISLTSKHKFDDAKLFKLER